MCESAMLAAAGVCHLAAKALEGPCAAYRASAFAMTAAAGVLLHARLWHVPNLSSKSERYAQCQSRCCAVGCCHRVPQVYIAACMLQARSAATGGQSEPKLLLHAAAELVTVVAQAAKETACAAAAALCTMTAVLLLAAALPLFVLPHKLLSWAVDRLQKLSWRLRGMQ